MEIRRFKKADAVKTSKCIAKTLRACSAPHYPKSVILFLEKEYSSKKLAEMTQERSILVAEANGGVIGTAGLTQDGWLGGFFVHPSFQGKAVGSRLLKRIEQLARKKNFKALRTHCAVNSVGFYKKRGYRIVKPFTFKKYGRTYRLFKRL